MTNTKEKNLKAAEVWIQQSQMGFFTGVFTAFTTQKGKYFLMEKEALLHMPLQIFVFPVAAMLEIAETAVALKLLYSSKNRNLGKTLDALKKLQKATTITAAITLGMVGVITSTLALVAVVPYLFMAAIGLNTLYSFGQFIKNTYKYIRAPKNSSLREIYKKRMIETGIRSLVGSVLSVTVGLLFVVAISSPIGLAITSSVGIAFIIGAVVAGVVLNRRAKKRAAKAALPKKSKAPVATLEQTDPLKKSSKIEMALKEGANRKTILEATVAGFEKHKKDYYYTRNIPRLLNAARNVDGVDKRKGIFLEIIEDKLERLRAKINDQRGWFKGYEKIKHQHKEKALEALKNLITGNKSGFIEKDEFEDIIAKYPKLFQSFFKNKGDVEVIFDAAREHFVNQAVVMHKVQTPALSM